jgi:hypothetical protein
LPYIILSLRLYQFRSNADKQSARGTARNLIDGRFHRTKSTNKYRPRNFALFSFPDLMRGRHALSYRIFESFQAESADIDPASAVNDLLRQRLPERRRVFESMA